MLLARSDAAQAPHSWSAGRRSVQTQLSLAESIGYSPDFVTEEEPQGLPGCRPRHDGMIVAGLLCMCASVAALVAGTIYLVLSIVA